MPNDIIKLGRVRFKVREIVSPAYTKKQVKALKKMNIIKKKMTLMDEKSIDNGGSIQFGVVDENDPEKREKSKKE